MRVRQSIPRGRFGHEEEKKDEILCGDPVAGGGCRGEILQTPIASLYSESERSMQFYDLGPASTEFEPEIIMIIYTSSCRTLHI
jgi:hypothetical protein